jgi:deferrochelatase/peroxidase EfeB
MTPITRRRLLASAGAGAAGLGLGGAGGFLIGQETAEASGDGTGSVAFHGEHQGGIDTAAQDRLHFAAFDLVTNSRAELRELLREWSRAAAEMTAHVRLASPSINDGERILRRGYSFTDGVDESLGELEAGLFFICFQRDPRRQFVPIQRRLGSSDALNEYIKHVGSAVFAVPPGARKGGYVGETLLG